MADAEKKPAKERGGAWLLAIIAAGTAYHLFAVTQLSSSPFFGNPILDARYQIEWAFALAEGKDPHPIFFQSPLYSYLIAVWIKLFGWHVWALVILQWALLLCSIFLFYRILLHFKVGLRLRLILLGFVFIYPLLPFYAVMLHKTSLEMFLHVLVMYLGVKLLGADCARRRIAAVVFGFVCGLAALVRSTFQAVPILAALLVKKPRAAAVLLLLAAFVLPVSWGIWHNYRGAGELVPLQTSFGYTLYLGNNPSNPNGVNVLVPGISNNPLKEESSSNAFAEKAAGRKLGIEEVNDFYTAKVRTFISDSPKVFFKTILKKLYWYLHREELPDNECFGCMRKDFAAFSYNPLNWGWLVIFVFSGSACHTF